MQIDVVDGRTLKTGRSERALHGEARPGPIRMRTGHVIGIAGFAAGQQQHRAVIDSCRQALEQRKGRSLADREAIACAIERPARRARDQLQGIKTIQRRQAQRIHPAHHGRIYYTGRDHALRGGERLGARGASRAQRHRWAFQFERTAYVVAHREGILSAGIIEILRQLASVRVASPVGQLSLEDARRAGAQQDADTLRPPTPRARAHGLLEAVLLQPELCQAVVAAVIGPQVPRQLHGIELRYLTDLGIEHDALEAAGGQAAARGAQCRQCRGQTMTETAGRGEMTQQQRRHRARAISSALANGVPSLIRTSASLSKLHSPNSARHCATLR